MGPVERLRHAFHRLAGDPPGQRFRRHYHRRREQGEEHPVRRYTLLTVGVAAVLAGLAMLVLPGPGLFSILVGLILITARAHWAAHWLDRAEARVRARLPQRFRHPT